jgi:hypothetical protein
VSDPIAFVCRTYVATSERNTRKALTCHTVSRTQRDLGNQCGADIEQTKGRPLYIIGAQIGGAGTSDMRIPSIVALRQDGLAHGA